MQNSNIKSKVLSLITGIFVFGVYLYSLCPTIAVGDSGEFVTASSCLALPHPSSYPLFSLLGKIAITMVPFGNIAYRVNVLSAVLGVFSVILIFLCVKKIAGNIMLSLFCALMFAFSRVFWLQSLVTEVFTLNTFFVVLLIYVLLTGKELLNYLPDISSSSEEKSPIPFPLIKGDKRGILEFKSIYIFSFLLGLGLGNHQTLIFMVPAFIWYLWLKWSGNVNKNNFYKAIIIAALFLVAGLSVYLFLPIRSLHNPPMDWGNPETWEKFWRVLTRADYGTLKLTLDSGNRPLPVTDVIVRYFTALNNSYLLLPLILGLFGLVISLKQNYRLGWFLLILFIVSGPGFIVISQLPDKSESWGVLERFYIFSLVIVTIGIPSIFKYFEYKVNKMVYVTILSVLLLFCPIICLFSYYPEVNRRNCFIEYDYGRNVLKTLPKNSYFIMEGGDDTFFSTAYLVFAEKRRTDIGPFDRGGLIFRQHPYGSDFRSLIREDKQVRRESVEKQLIQGTNRPVYYSTLNPRLVPDINFELAGFLYHANPTQDDKRKESGLWYLYNLRGLGRKYEEYRVRALTPMFYYFKGMWLEKQGRIDEALQYWDFSLYQGSDVDWLKGNASIMFSELGVEYFNRASVTPKNTGYVEQLYLRAIKYKPDYALAYCNLGVVYEKMGNDKLARETYEKAISVDPGYAQGYYNLAVLYWRKADWQQVVRLLEKVCQLQPDNMQARGYLSQAQMRLQK